MLMPTAAAAAALSLSLPPLSSTSLRTTMRLLRRGVLGVTMASFSSSPMLLLVLLKPRHAAALGLIVAGSSSHPHSDSNSAPFASACPHSSFGQLLGWRTEAMSPSDRAPRSTAGTCSLSLSTSASSAPPDARTRSCVGGSTHPAPLRTATVFVLRNYRRACPPRRRCKRSWSAS
ncbi:hypothetical protein B484DRAFT_220683 [Ochromonadaceae sp. CCMP2298]|nr:hypothetical protein B484DRAFT_220683 [Ochromonadaceae sp. CCMP2298]